MATRRFGATVALALVTVLLAGAALERQRDVVRMTDAARAFLASLSGEQRERATFEFESEERQRFHFIPVEMFERAGVMIAELDDTQRAAAHELLRSGLSRRGYLTATQVMELEDVLRELEGGRRFARDRDEYLFSVFGRPESGGTWGWRFEGHHISLHFTIVDGDIVVAAPAFVGSNPADVRDGPQAGRRVLGDREDAGRALMSALDRAQRETALIDVEAPRDIFTGNAAGVDPLEPLGVESTALRPDQKRLLAELVDVYLGMMADDIYSQRMARMSESGDDRMWFAWAGSVEKGEPHYYRVQGATFLIEYDNTQNDANHIHSVWRDFDGDFGRDVLREHRSQHPH